jgi:beta-1,4-mannosyl-glycoprotein beta-1,4-N-acetylglucosaminyltransferase|tara:strand:+ start:1124 stop:1915 length:792 start_codon:yes stop_codon:yes gene_type:complete
MAIYDSCIYFDEDLVLNLRLNILDKYVDHFIIVEGKKDHQGNDKKLNFKIEKFIKFKDKIRYIVVDNFPESNYTWNLEHHQRNAITNGLLDAKDDDIVIISDVDEIPNPKVMSNFLSKNRYAIFEQKMFHYKLNLQSKNEVWYGSKMCVKKFLKSPNWLRYKIKSKKYPFYRIDKPKTPQIIKNGGWHFSFLMSPKDISKKIKSYAHKEFHKPEFTDENKIEEKIKNRIDIFNRDIKYERVELDDTFPDYILENLNKFQGWII